MTQAITRAESRNFRIARIAWPFLFALIMLLLSTSIRPSLLNSLAAIEALLMFYLLLWRCPRCRGFYSVKLSGGDSFFGIAWPYFNQCLHCSSKLETGGSHNPSSSGGA